MKDPILKRPSERSSHRDRSEEFSRREIGLVTNLQRSISEGIKLPHSHTYYWEHGYRSGDLHESNLWQIAGGIGNPRPFSVRESIDIPACHVGVLVDCSGSMHSHLGGFQQGTVMSASRCLAMAFAKALDDKEEVKISVAGHTEEGGKVHLIMIKRPNVSLVPENFNALSAQSGNIDGVALLAFAREMAREKPPNENGLIVLICDGAPCHSPAVMRKSIDMCWTNYNLKVIPIAVGHEITSDTATCNSLYGSGNYITAPNVLSSIPTIVTRLNLMIAELKPM